MNKEQLVSYSNYFKSLIKEETHKTNAALTSDEIDYITKFLGYFIKLTIQNKKTQFYITDNTLVKYINYSRNYDINITKIEKIKEYFDLFDCEDALNLNFPITCKYIDDNQCLIISWE